MVAKLRLFLSALALLLFAAVWLWLCWEFYRYTPTEAKPELPIDTFQTTVAALLAGTVASATAAFLGIEIAKANQTLGVQASRWAALSDVFQRKHVLVAGVVTYAVVGIVVLLLTFGDSAKAPELFETFALTLAGWVLGSMTAVFTAD